jgi:hypothetical protein
VWVSGTRKQDRLPDFSRTVAADEVVYFAADATMMGMSATLHGPNTIEVDGSSMLLTCHERIPDR